MNLLAIIQNGIVHFHCEAGGPIQAKPGGVGRWTSERLECDVGSQSRRDWTRFRR